MARPTGEFSGHSGGGHSSSRNSGGHRIGGGRPMGGTSGDNYRRDSSFDALDAIRLASTIGAVGREITRTVQHNRDMERARQREDERERAHRRDMERRYSQESGTYTPSVSRESGSYDSDCGESYTTVNHSRMGGNRIPPESPEEPKKSIPIRILGALQVFCCVMIMLFAFMGPIGYFRAGDGREAHEKLQGTTFSADCIIDNDGWFSSPKSTAKVLEKVFFKPTGIQPYIVINEYMPYFNNDSDKQAYAEEWYTNNIANENTFLFMYFPEQDPNRIGYMSYVNGKEVSSIMDSDVIEKFWNLMDKYWEHSSSTEKLFETVYKQTADYAMKEVASANDILLQYGIELGFFVLLFVIVSLIKVKIKRDEDRARETERILNSDITTIGDEELFSDAESL